MSAADELDARIVVVRDGFTLDVDLHIPAGTTAALLGPNGAGKSTTVAAVAGVVPLTDGHIRVGERVLDDPSAGVLVAPQDRRVGVVFQSYLLFDHLTVLDNVAFGPASTGRSRRDARAAARPWLDALQLTDLADRRPRQLSGGESQRVALARTLAADPAVLLLDEPLAALDVTTRAELRRLLHRHLGEFDGPRLVITHDPADAMLLADRIHLIEDGRITQVGAPDDIRRRPATAFAAALAGTNLLTGTADRGALTLDGSSLVLHSADTATTGGVLVTVHPTAVALHAAEPQGSPRNSWATTVASVEPLGDTVRVMLGAPLRLAVDITPGAVTELGLVVGSPVWAAVKATEVHVSSR